MDETMPPERLVKELARRKAASVAEQVESGVILSADTVAECEGRILGKPVDRADAARMLGALSGTRHRVYSGVCLWRRPEDALDVRFAVTTLEMDPLSEQQLNAYLDSGGWQGKAGAFGYQDRLGWVHILEGSESNVVGLPMELVERMLSEGAGT